MNNLKQVQDNNFQDIKLNKTQIILLKILATGHSLKEIAQVLGVSYNTVKTRTKLLYKKFEVSNRADLIHKALDLKLLSRKDIKSKFYKKFILKKIDVKTQANLTEALTPQEITYLKHSAHGMTANEIIETMNLTGIYHAKYLKWSVCYKLNSNNITEAAYNAQVLGII